MPTQVREIRGELHRVGRRTTPSESRFALRWGGRLRCFGRNRNTPHRKAVIIVGDLDSRALSVRTGELPTLVSSLEVAPVGVAWTVFKRLACARP